jgi:LysR family glycine cleavage system transcriptional activator
MYRRECLPPLNPTRAFEAAGRLLSVTKAAEEMHVTPAAVSRQVRLLEDFIGTPLFTRSHGRLTLTPAGAHYLSELVPLFARLREVTSAMVQGSNASSVLRIRSPATFAVRWLIPRLASFHQAYKTVDVQLTTSSSPLDFEVDDLDGGVQLGNGDWLDLHARQLVPNELLPVMSASLPMPSLKQLSDATFLHSIARIDDWAVWLEANGLSTTDAYRGMKYETSMLGYQAALEGHGIAMAQKVLVERDLASGTLIALLPPVDRGKYTYYFTWPRNRPASRELLAFSDWLSSLNDKERQENHSEAFTKSKTLVK